LNGFQIDIGKQQINEDHRYRDILVPASFSYDMDWNVDRRFLHMGRVVGLNQDSGGDLNAVLRDLIGKVLMIFVNRRYPNGKRRDRANDFRPLQKSEENTVQIVNDLDIPL
jgi:hypothetical protein